MILQPKSPKGSQSGRNLSDSVVEDELMNLKAMQTRSTATRERRGEPPDSTRIVRLPRSSRTLVRFAVAALVLFFLLILVVQPVGWLVFNSLHDDETGHWTLTNYQAMVGQMSLIEPMLNSLLLGFAVATVSTGFGVPLAWLVARTDLPGRSIIRAMLLATFVTPSFIGATAWIMLAAPNSGWINFFVRSIFGTQGVLVNIYSLTGAIFVSAIYTVPYAFTVVATALDEMSADLEDAATTLGSGTFRTMLSVTFPLAMPAIISGFILSFVQGVTLFGVPAFLLVPAGIPVVTTKLAEFYQLFPPALYASAAYCMPLLLVTGMLFWIRKRILGRRQYVMVGGKAQAKRIISLKRLKWPAFIFAMIIPVLAVLLPYFVLLLVSLSRSWGKGISFDNFSLYWYDWMLFRNTDTIRAILNSLSYSAAAATVGIFLGVTIAYIVERKLISYAGLLGALASVPIIIPGIVLSVGFFSAFTQPPLKLYGTASIMIAAFTSTFLPVAYTQGGNIIKGIGRELEQAALSLGVSESRTFFGITVPLMRAGLVSGWLLVFIPAIRELSTVIFIITPRTNVMTTLIYNAKDGGSYESLCAMSILLLLTTLMIILLIRGLERSTSRRRLDNRLVTGAGL